MNKNIGIDSIGSAVGEYYQTNDELEKSVTNYDAKKSNKTLDQWVKQHFGIITRVKTKSLPSEIAYKAALNALSTSNYTAADIDFIVLNTATGNHKQPTTATAVQGLLGLRKDTFAIELNMPCAGLIYGITIAKSFVETGLGKVGLVVGVDKMSDLIDQEDFIMAAMFGDGASACIIGKNAKWNILDSFLQSQDDKEKALCIPAGGSVNKTSVETVKNKMHFLYQKGKETSAFINFSVTTIVNQLLTNNQLKPDQINQVIPHQASKTIVSEALTKSGFKENQMHFTIQKYGNTSAASILVTFADYLTQYNPKDGDFVILFGMGGGLNIGGILCQYKQKQ